MGPTHLAWMCVGSLPLGMCPRRKLQHNCNPPATTQSRLLLGRVLVVLEHGVGLGRVIVHRRGRGGVGGLGASVWLVSDVACQQSFQQVRESRVALHAREHERRSGSGSAAEHGGGTWLACHGKRVALLCCHGD
eukprot:scaffold50862_cov65-Phaeocystis_antarctica.AAC.2